MKWLLFLLVPTLAGAADFEMPQIPNIKIPDLNIDASTAWGEAGRMAYGTAASIMHNNNSRTTPIPSSYKKFLKRYIDPNLVERALVAHKAQMLEDIRLVSGFKLDLQSSIAQTYGFRIYLKQEPKQRDCQYASLLVHERKTYRPNNCLQKFKED